MNSQFVIPFAAAFRLASSIAEASMSTPMTCLAPPPCPYVCFTRLAKQSPMVPVPQQTSSSSVLSRSDSQSPMFL